MGADGAGSRAFGRRLRAVRRQAGLSQTDLAHLAHVLETQLSRYENGHTSPSITTLSRLARALGVSEGWLLTETPSVMEEFLHELVTRGVVLRSHDDVHELASRTIRIAAAHGLVRHVGADTAGSTNASRDPSVRSE